MYGAAEPLPPAPSRLGAGGWGCKFGLAPPGPMKASLGALVLRW